MTKLGTDEFVARLAERHPALRDMLKEHREYHGEVLPHVFFGDVTRWYVSRCEASDNIASARGLVTDLAEGLTLGDDSVDNLIHVSFLENLDREQQGVAWELLPSGLKAGFDLIHGYRSAP